MAGGFVKNFVAQLNAKTPENGPVRVAATPVTVCSHQVKPVSRTRSVVLAETPAFTRGFRSREVGDAALPTVIKGTRGADGAPMPLRPSAANHCTNIEPGKQGSTAPVTEEGSPVTAANARAFWEAKASSTKPTPLTKKAGSQLRSFSIKRSSGKPTTVHEATAVKEGPVAPNTGSQARPFNSSIRGSVTATAKSETASVEVAATNKTAKQPAAVRAKEQPTIVVKAVKQPAAVEKPKVSTVSEDITKVKVEHSSKEETVGSASVCSAADVGQTNCAAGNRPPSAAHSAASTAGSAAAAAATAAAASAAVTNFATNVATDPFSTESEEAAVDEAPERESDDSEEPSVEDSSDGETTGAYTVGGADDSKEPSFEDSSDGETTGAYTVGGADDSEEPADEDSSDGETAGGYTIGGADDDSEEEDDKTEDSSDEETGGYSFGNNDDSDDDDDDDDDDDKEGRSKEQPSEAEVVEETKVTLCAYQVISSEPMVETKAEDQVVSSTEDDAPAETAPTAVLSPGVGIWMHLTSGTEFAAPPIRRRRNVEGEMEEEEQDDRPRCIGFSDTVTVFEDDLAGSQHLYTFLFNW